MDENEEKKKTIWEVLEKLVGSIEGPADWADEHDHYLYGGPKKYAKPGDPPCECKWCKGKK